MWFRLPEGCGGISVELQHFSPEVEDTAGRKYFRAPNHFAAKILMLQGFEAVEPPEGAPEDLPLPDPLRDGAIAELTGVNENLRRELEEVRTDLAVATAKINALMNGTAELEAKAKGLEAQLEEKAEE